MKHMASLGVALLAAGVSLAQANPVAPEAVKFEDYKVEASLTGAPGNAENGSKVFSDRRLGNCLACHANSAKSNELFHGDVGPEIDGVGERYSEAEIRAIIVNSKAVFGEQTVMPGFYSLEVGVDVAKDFQGKTILTAEQVEDIVAYLMTLK